MVRNSRFLPDHVERLLPETDRVPGVNLQEAPRMVNILVVPAAPRHEPHFKHRFMINQAR
jgi:hypothetical protein